MHIVKSLKEKHLVENYGMSEKYVVRRCCPFFWRLDDGFLIYDKRDDFFERGTEGDAGG